MSGGANTDVLFISSSRVGASANLQFSSPTLIPLHLGGQIANPPTIAPGAGLGTGGTASIIAGSDLAGQMQLVSGTGATIGGVLATMTFFSAYTAAPSSVVLFPANAAAAGFVSAIYNSGTTMTTATFTNALTAPGISTTYLFNYIVIQ